MRLFVAAELPAGARAQLARHGRALAAAGGWRAVPEESLHVTLAFLGERDDGSVDAIAAAVAAALAPVGEIALGHALLLPPRRPRVAAVSLTDPDGRLSALQAAVSGSLARIGAYEPERRPFLAHVTVARRSGGRQGAVAEPEWSGAGLEIDHVTLYASRLSPRGARHEPLARLALG